MNVADFAKPADEIIALADKVIPSMSLQHDGSAVNYSAADNFAFRSSGLSFLANAFGVGRPESRFLPCGEVSPHVAAICTVRLERFGPAPRSPVQRPAGAPVTWMRPTIPSLKCGGADGES